MTFTLSKPASQPAVSKSSSTEYASLKQEVKVTFNYDVHFTRDLFNPDNPLLAQVLLATGEGTKKAIAFVDSGLPQQTEILAQIQAYSKCHSYALNLKPGSTLIAGGEAAKNNPQLVENLQKLISDAELCRHSYVIAVGGGAMLDLVGYAAATAHRGIRLIRVPTTVLGQCDSGVGVKNGINAFGKKNFLGTFAPPTLVLNDANFLTTLDDRNWRSGIAEAVKVALIKDAAFFDFIANHTEALVNRDLDTMQQIVYRCAKLHLDHIAGGDPFEMGSSRPLDFGHWAAHRIEYLSNYRLYHGEAVAIGICLDSTYSYLSGLITKQELNEILNLFKALGFRLYDAELSSHFTSPEHSRSLFRGLSEFQEHLGGELTLMLLATIGQGLEVHQVDLDKYRLAIMMLKEADL
ncbi:3-dehydroquinate synthase family protein [Lyngbya aestuarii BL J]|uniref:3-dehydroquinate synthase family protein n=1 Tax=Lyngbya aestuarii BL J TaxID=1348334 RepID=U7QNA2_9CYAN|nr:3-dehydroquinate synthase [Lyngbya aestuarii]ERT08585.1 3-dehydroquinate synthase family protein [Lyngbya aestuarii BL J]